MIRKIVKIDEEKCNGCGDCVPNCAEGALQIIDGKARLISDLFCDGLGACIGHCPTGAITIEEREAEPYNEWKVMDYIVKGGANVIKAHLEHLLDHNEVDFYNEAIEYLKSKSMVIPEHNKNMKKVSGCGCNPDFQFDERESTIDDSVKRQSELRQWPIQLHLISPTSGYYKESDLLLAADCVAFSYGDFHKDFLRGKSLAIACPKLDTNKEAYIEKIVSLVDVAKVKSITVLIMQVPCCGGLVQLVNHALNFTERSIDVNTIVVGINGEILN